MRVAGMLGMSVSGFSIGDIERSEQIAFSLSSDVSFAPILLQKSFWGGDRKFPKPLMRFTRGEVRDHIVSSKIDNAPP